MNQESNYCREDGRSSQGRGGGGRSRGRGGNSRGFRGQFHDQPQSQSTYNNGRQVSVYFIHKGKALRIRF